MPESVVVAMIRHGRTRWNEEGRIQGQIDAGLSPAGRRLLAGVRVGGGLRDHAWWSSPLTRAMDTARALGARSLRTDPRLMEMGWGEWEGRSRRSLRTDPSIDLERMEALGPAFRPPGGESPRELQMRLLDWLDDVARDGEPVMAVTHKGVLKGALGLAFDWDLRGKSPVRLDWDCIHRFVYRAGPRTLSLQTANIALERRT